MRRVVLKSPVLGNCTPGSVRGAPGNRRPYLAIMLAGPEQAGLHNSAKYDSVRP